MNTPNPSRVAASFVTATDVASTDTPVSRVAAQYLSKTASGDSLLDFVIPQSGILKLISHMEDERDAQSAQLAGDVYQELYRACMLESRESNALKRLKASIERIGSWDAGAQRNNIFKAADELRMKLPSPMFASVQDTKTATDKTAFNSPPSFNGLVKTSLMLTVKNVGQASTNSERPVWDVTGTIGIFPITFTELPFSMLVYGGQSGTYDSLLMPGVDPRATKWIHRYLDIWWNDGSNGRQFVQYCEQQAGR